MNRNDGVYENGEDFFLHIASERSGYIYILNQSEEGTKLIYPNVHRAENLKIHANTTYRIPIEQTTFQWRIDGKVGSEESIILVVSEQPMPMAVFGLKSTDSANTPPQVNPNLFEMSNPVSVVGKYSLARAVVKYRIVAKRESSEQPQGRKRIAVIFSLTHVYNTETEKYEKDTNYEFRVGNFILLMNALKAKGSFSDYIFLTGENFTKDNVRETLKKATAATKPDDEIFIYWEGHGGTGIRDTTESESDNRHEYLLMSNHHKGRDGIIVDDEFAEMLTVLKGRRVMLLMEVCHGGGMLESKQVQIPKGPEFTFSENYIARYCNGKLDFGPLMARISDVINYSDLQSGATSESSSTTFSSFFNNDKKQVSRSNTLSGALDDTNVSSSESSKEDTPVFLRNVQGRFKSFGSNDINRNTPGLAAIFSASKHESSWCAVIDTKGNVVKVKDQEGVERLISSSVCSFLMAMNDKEGKFCKDKNCARFDDVWNVARVLIPQNMERLAQLTEKAKGKTQVPVYMNTIPDVCVRPAR